MSERILAREMTFDERASIERWPDECTEAVTRDGWEGPCEKPAVAVRVDPNGGDPYPVCAFHARGQMVALRDVIGVDFYGRLALEPQQEAPTPIPVEALPHEAYNARAVEAES